jgi:hypothetical protein
MWEIMEKKLKTIPVKAGDNLDEPLWTALEVPVKTWASPRISLANQCSSRDSTQTELKPTISAGEASQSLGSSDGGSEHTLRM